MIIYKPNDHFSAYRLQLYIHLRKSSGGSYLYFRLSSSSNVLQALAWPGPFRPFQTKQQSLQCRQWPGSFVELSD
jgi:hypothetical protein